ncbi:helix-turn-helix domain-containing protein [Acinetobacter sp. ANC 4636]|uniref:helix-turn-helix domain-containing protein n=1 Tax=Acinetobacter sp. ANC 3791 TaxID=2529836 RepID=UPI00103EB453|nr:helix-turn-helix transcriptional regulator [Acinetobacter sp. ANC 3791]TCB86321.1 XRE family transcriptional regulator [Acinetobacter sp. ANC 3791]
MKNDDLNTRGNRLRDERKRLGIETQDELAEILGVKKNSIVRYEKHNAALDMDQLDLLEDHGFNVAYILWGRTEAADSSLSEEETKLLGFYRQTREEMRGGLVAIVETYANQFK